MNSPDKQQPLNEPPRKHTPRVPANVFYERILPVVLILAAIVLFIILAVVVLSAGQTY